MKYKVCNCSSLKGICFKDGKKRKIKIIFKNAKTSKYQMILWVFIKSVPWTKYIKYGS